MISKPFLASLFIGFISNTFANSNSVDLGLLYAIEEINHGSQTFSPSYLQCLTDKQLLPNYYVDQTEAKYRQQCARALCGSPDYVKSVYVNKKNISQYTNPDLVAKLDRLTPKLQAALQKIRESKMAALKDVEQNLLSKGTLNINPETWAGTDFEEDINRRVFDQYIKMDINKNGPIGKRITFRVTDPGSVPTAAQEALKEYVAIKENFLNNNLSEAAKYNLYNKEDALKLIKERSATLTEKLKKLSPKRNSYEDNMLKEALSSVDTAAKNFNDPQEILEHANSGLSAIEGLITQKDPKYKPTYDFPRCTSGTCKKAYENYIKMLKPESIISTYKDSLNSSTAFERSINKCKAMVVASESEYSSAIRSEQLFKEVLPDFLKNVVGSFSVDTKKYFDNYFKNKLEISHKKFNPQADIFPSAKRFAQFENLLDTAINDGGPQSYDESVTLGEILKYSEGDIPNPLAQMGFCNNDLSATSWDAFLNIDKLKNLPPDVRIPEHLIPKKDTIFISAFTCSHAEVGRSVIAHELGHALNDGFYKKNASSKSREHYLKLRKCVANNYNNQPLTSVESGFEGDGIKTEEDTADIFAFMAYKNDTNFFTCSMLKPNDTETKFVDLFLAEDAENNHSSPFYRLIMEAINKGIKMPPSCQLVIDKNKNLMEFKKCIEY